jgi:hypothetical protein
MRVAAIAVVGLILAPSLVAADDAVHVTISVKPGKSPTTIEPNSRGMLPVAILSTRDFDATVVDPASILVGPSGTEAEPFRTMQEDVNGDGRTDMLVLVRYSDLKVKCETKIIKLTGKTSKGISIEGSQQVSAEGCEG